MRKTELKEEYLEEFFVEVLKIKEPRELKEYLKKMLSEQALHDISKKLEIVELIKAGKAYREIQEELRVSSRTIRNLKIGKPIKTIASKDKAPSIPLEKSNKIYPRKRKKPLYYKGLRVN